MRYGKRPLFVVVMLAALLVAALVPGIALGQGEDVLEAEPRRFELVQGWFQGRETFYYDFGANTSSTAGGATVVTAPIYVLARAAEAGGDPQPVEGQANIIDVLPGQEGYSDLWQVMLVEVPDDYEANTLRSAEAVLDAGYPITPTDQFVNCPVVPAGSTLSEGGAPLVQGWYRDQEVFYFDFGANPPTTAPIFALITGMDAQGNPEFVEGQGNIIDVLPGDPGYSDFWYVNLVTVPEDYVAGTIRSAQEVADSGFAIQPAGLTVNCPVLRTAQAQADMTPTVQPGMTPRAPGTLPETGGALSGGAAALVATGAALIGLGVGMWRRRSAH